MQPIIPPDANEGRGGASRWISVATFFMPPLTATIDGICGTSDDVDALRATTTTGAEYTRAQLLPRAFAVASRPPGTRSHRMPNAMQAPTM